MNSATPTQNDENDELQQWMASLDQEKLDKAGIEQAINAGDIARAVNLIKAASAQPNNVPEEIEDSLKISMAFSAGFLAATKQIEAAQTQGLASEQLNELINNRFNELIDTMPNADEINDNERNVLINEWAKPFRA